MSDETDKPAASNAWLLSRLAALGLAGWAVKIAPFVVIGGALVIAADGCYRWRRDRLQRETKEAEKREAIKRAITEKEKADASR